MNEKVITLIRHTQPDIAAGICYGQTDIGVAESFAREAAEIRSWMQSIDLLIISPLIRTKRLAEYLSEEFSCVWREDARLMEMDFGEWEGRNWDDIPRHEIDAWGADILHYQPPGGESACQLMQRVKLAWHDAVLLPQRHVGLVTHGGSMRAMLSMLGDVPMKEAMSWQIDYGAVIEVKLTE